MQVIDILLEQQINSIAALRDAFNIEQWYNIISYYNYDRLRSASASERNAFLSRADREIGSKTNTYQSLSDWLVSANRYKMKFNRGVSVQDIYNEIAPHASRKVIDYSTQEPVADMGMDDDYTTEEFAEFQTWAPSSVDEFNTTTEAYDRIRAVESAIIEKRGQEWMNIVKRDPEIPNAWNHAANKIYGIVRNQGSISRQDLDVELYGWLRVADYAHHTNQNQ